jgi:hypothetical protein
MTNTRAVWRLLLSVPMLGLLAPACLRLSEPDSFICFNAADCLADERCSSQGVCVPKGSCEQNSDCDVGQTCQNGGCQAAECYQGHEGACGAFRCEYYTGHCYRACTAEYECQNGNRCKDGACAPTTKLANDQTCSESTECASGACCGSPNSKVCKQACGAAGSSSCQAASECASGNCCWASPFAHTCSTSACVPFDLGHVCSLSTDCATGTCTNGVCAARKCQADNECPAGFCASGSCETQRRADGAVCNADPWCISGSCIDKICRSKVKPGASCSLDRDCEATSVCCVPSGADDGICSPHNVGCSGDIGERCDYAGDDACLMGSCIGDSFCTVTCSLDSDCRVSPWGAKNFCRKNRAGVSICFPGCANEAHCSANLGENFRCSTSSVCSGDYLSDDDVRVQ